VIPRILCGGLVCAAIALGATRAEASDQELIVYWSDDPFPSIWAMNSDGSGAHRLLDNDQNAKRPRLSPDRQLVAFDGTPPGKTPMSDFDIELVATDGSGLCTLTESPMWDLDAQWIPGRPRISFNRMPAGAIRRRSWIWSVGLDGSDPRRITRGTDGRWSPTGRKLVVSSPTRTSDGELFVVNADGTGRKQLTRTRDLESAAAWSRNGTRILYTSATRTSPPSTRCDQTAAECAGSARGSPPAGRRMARRSSTYSRRSFTS
jgi:Tol biopolymer transport system component